MTTRKKNNSKQTNESAQSSDFQTKIELEAAIACCLLMRGDDSANLVDIDTNDISYLPARAVIAAAKQKDSIDIMIVKAFAKANNVDISVAQLSGLLNAAATSKNLSHYVLELKKLLFQQKYTKLKDEFAVKAKDCSDLSEIAHELVYAEHQLKMKYLDDSDGGSMVDYCAELINNIDERKENESLVRTGWDMLDKLNGGGFLPNEVIVLAARPSIGKTAAALQLVCCEKAVMFALEMDKKQIAPRLLARTAKKNTLVAAREPAKLTDDERIHFLNHSSQLLELAEKIIVYDEADQNMSFIRRKARKEVERGAKFIIIDYLQLLDDEKSKLNRERMIAKFSRAIKNMAKELNVPVFVLAQLNRACEIDGRPPRSSDLRESGAIEQDANVIILLYPTEDKFANEDGSPSKMQNIIFKKDKGRDTGQDARMARFNPDHQTFYEIEQNK